MTIRERVARAICKADTAAPEPDAPIYIAMRAAKAWEGRKDMATAAITAFLEAAAEEGWHMRPDEATEAMKIGITAAWLEEKPPTYMYRAMLAAAPPFEWDE